MGIKLAVLALCLFVSQLALGQAAPTEITNSDVISMTKAGIGEQTIILAIQRGPVKLDTSPQALIILKKAGLSDQVLNAVLAASNSDVATKPVKTSRVLQSQGTRIQEDKRAVALFQKALDAIGPKAKVLGIQSTQSTSTYTATTSSGTSKSYDTDVTRVYPDKRATIFKSSTGENIKEVVTQEFGYTSSGEGKALLGDRIVAIYQQNLKLEPIYIAQHSQDYSVDFVGTENQGRMIVDLLRISISGKSIVWAIESQTGVLLSSRVQASSGDDITIYSDYRFIDGIHIPFHSVATSNGESTEYSTKEFTINSSIDATLFTPPPLDAQSLFNKALDAIGPTNAILRIRSIRSKADVVETSSGSTSSLERELTRVFPDSAAKVDTATGINEVEVVTHDFGYRTQGETKKQMPWVDVVTLQQFLKLDPINVAQHPQNYKVQFACQGVQETANCSQLLITDVVSNASIVWSVDLHTGRLISARTLKPLSEQQTDFSDYRLVSDIYRPFHTVTTSGGHRTEVSVRQYEINPYIDTSLFAKPDEPVSAPAIVRTPTVATIPAGPSGLTLRVIQSESVPYVQESGGGISTSCNIVGTANTSAYANTMGNSTFGNATTNSNQHMSCNSYDTTMRWPHVLNVMFAQASDGNSYIIACDRAWRWSKCNPLRAGEVFSASFTGAGIEVQAVNSKGKEESITYKVLQSRAGR